MALEKKHWALIAGFVSAVGAQLLVIPNWSAALTPGFAALVLIQMGLLITSIFVGAPGAAAALEQANKNTDMANASTKAALSLPMDLGKVDPKRFLGSEDLDIG